MASTDSYHFRSRTMFVHRYVPVSEADCASTTYEYGPYADAPQALGHKVTVSAPWVHAMALEELAEHLGRPGARALDVGCGSGVLVAAMVRIYMT